MFEIEKDTKKIHLTRGDIACIDVTANNKVTGTLHIFEVGDVIRLNVVKKGDYSQIVLQKDITVDEQTEIVMIPLTSDETRIGEVISKPTTYWYEIELNPDTDPQTIIGHDKKSGAKIFMLYPEGGDK